MEPSGFLGHTIITFSSELRVSGICCLIIVRLWYDPASVLVLLVDLKMQRYCQFRDSEVHDLEDFPSVTQRCAIRAEYVFD